MELTRQTQKRQQWFYPSVEEILFYQMHGYLLRRGVFSTFEIASITDSLLTLEKLATQWSQTTMHLNSQFVVDGKAIHRIVWCCGAEPRLDVFALDARLTQTVGGLLSSNELDQVICQAHFKIPGDQVEFDWHQDSQHRGYGTESWTDVDGFGSFVQTLVAIDPMTISSGPIAIWPGSHLWGHLGLDQTERREMLVDTSQLYPLMLEPGDVVFFHPFLVHGSRPNNSKQPRRVFINGYALPNANHRSYPGCGLGRKIKL